jgi:hypothetical protein
MKSLESTQRCNDFDVAHAEYTTVDRASKLFVLYMAIVFTYLLKL